MVSPDPDDGRGVIVTLTDVGRGWLHVIRNVYPEFGGVDAEELTRLCSAAERTAAVLAGLGSQSKPRSE
jgi:DNA-binding MarR family transcriptional regulator